MSSILTRASISRAGASRRRPLILGIGELLWDVLPEGPRLGGAPANFAVMAGRLGNRAAILSRIGSDDLGRRAVETLEPLPADTGYLQVDPTHGTGTVTVTLRHGQADYAIHHPVAWDFLECSDAWLQLAERADAICFGTLAQRGAESRRTIQALAARTSAECWRVFDVNLRAPFYSSSVVRESLELANIVKMSDAEVPAVMSLLGLPAEHDAGPDPPRRSCARLLAEFPSLRMTAITRGAQGSFLMTRQEWNEHPGVAATVADTIGAGDAFTAALTHYLLRGAGLAVLNEAGNRWGAWAASQAGAMPALPESVRAGIEAEINACTSRRRR